VGRETFMREVIRPFNARMSVGLKPTVRKGQYRRPQPVAGLS
jgi:hypothetical protein